MMKANRLLIFSLIMSIFSGMLFAAEPVQTDSYYQTIKRAIGAKAHQTVIYTLEQLGIDTKGVASVIERLKKHSERIHKEVAILQQVVNRVPGPISQMEKVIRSLQQLKAHTAHILHSPQVQVSKIKGLGSIIREADELIVKIDQLQLNPLLKPARHILLSFADFFEDVLLLRGYLGKLGTLTISPEVVTLLENGIYDLRLLGSNLFDLITGGRRKLQAARSEMVKYVIVNRANIPHVATQLTNLELTTLPNIQAFLSNLAEITKLVIPMVEIAYDIPKAYEKGIEARKKESYFGFVGPYARAQEITNILTRLRDDVYGLLRYANNAVLAITNVVEIAVESIVKGLDEQLNFKIFKQRADRAARNLPPNARSLQRNIDQLQKAITNE